ncbi:MAG: DNA gyrase inhibitor YacG [Dongiaceae bacterium]
MSEKPCPVCKKPAHQEWKPFCSKGCKQLDLHRWLSGVYAVPTEEKPPEQDLENEEG